MTNPTPRLDTLTTRGLAGELVSSEFDGWSERRRQEFSENRFNGQVGGDLIMQTDDLRIWDIDLGPGESLPPHCHVLDYTWLALTAGTSRQLTADGSTRIVSYEKGDQKLFVFHPGEYLLHNLENMGDSRLRFLTVEFLDSANPPLPVS